MMCSRIAIAAFAVGLSLATSGAFLIQGGPAKAQSSPAPVIGRVNILGGAPGEIEGTAPPGAHIVVRANGKLVGHALADAKGTWRVAIARPLEAGEHKLTVTSRVLGVDNDVPGEEVRVAVPADGGPARAALPRVAGIGEEEQLRRAGALAEAATKRFDELMPKSGAAPSNTTQQAQAQIQTQTAPIRMAQATSPTQTPAVPSAKPDDDDILAPVWNWFERANRQYQGVIVKQLSEGNPATSLASPPAPAAPSTRTVVAPAPIVTPPKATTPNTVVGQVPPANQAPTAKTTPPATVAQAPTAPSVTPSAPAAKAPVATPPQAPATKAPAPTAAAAPVAAEKDIFDQLQDTVGDWLDRANRQYQTVIVRRLSDPNPNESAITLTRPSMPEQPPVAVAQQPQPPAGQAKAVEDAARLAEQQRRDTEAKRLVEAETKRAVDTKAKAEDDRKVAEAKAKADEERRIADAKAKSDEEAKRVAAATAAKADADRKTAEAKAKADEDRRVAEAKAKTDEERKVTEAKAKADEDRRVAEAKTKADEERRTAEAKAKADEESKRVAAAAAAKTKADDEARRAAEVKTRADEEVKRTAEAKIKADEERRQADAKTKAEADRKATAAAAAAVAAAALAAKSETDRLAAVAKAENEARRAADTKRVADASAAKAESERVAVATRSAQTKAEADRRLADQQKIAQVAQTKVEADRKIAADAAARKTEAAKIATPPADVTIAPPRRVTVQRTVRPATRYASSNISNKRRVASTGSMKYAKISSRSVCRQVAGQRVRPGNWYVVKRGDSLWHIAQMHYRDGSKFRLLMKANSLGKSREINPCQRILVPKMRTRA